VPVLILGHGVFLLDIHPFWAAALGFQENHSSLQAAVLFSSRGTGITFAMLLNMLSWQAGRTAGFVLTSRQASNSSIKATSVE
jgi:hypothetical protein